MRPFILPALALSAAAQQAVVSPAGLATVAGNTGFLRNFDAAARYLQIHSDLGAQPLVIGRLSLRQVAGTGTATGVIAHDLALWLGESRSFDTVTPVFADNFVRPPSNVIARRVVNLGPQGPQGNPSPFAGMDLVFDFPITRAPNTSIAWDVRFFGRQFVGAGNWNNADAHLCTYSQAGSPLETGSGCAGMRQRAPLALDCGGTLAAMFSCQGMPPQAPTVLALGLRNPNYAVPGLCSPLQTDVAVLSFVGTSNALGLLPADGSALLLVPNSLSGATLYSQFHSADFGQPGIPIRNSSGMSFTVPAANRAGVVRVTNIYDRFDPMAQRSGRFGVQYFIGAGVVTRFAP
jgi:hypothetical protein